MYSATFKQGVCCVCQCVVPVQYDQIVAQTEEDRDLWGFIGDERAFTCIEHYFYGEKCDGSGQCPQVLVEKK